MFKNVYFDAYEREDMVKYRQKDFFPTQTNLERQILVFAKDDSWTILSGLKKGEKLFIFVIYDTKTCNVNDRKRKIWIKKRKSTL